MSPAENSALEDIRRDVNRTREEMLLCLAELYKEVQIMRRSLRSCQSHCYVLAQRPGGLKGVWYAIKAVFKPNKLTLPMEADVELDNLAHAVSKE